MQIILCDTKSKLKKIFVIYVFKFKFKIHISYKGPNLLCADVLLIKTELLLRTSNSQCYVKITKAQFKIAFDAIYRCSTSIHFL